MRFGISIPQHVADGAFDPSSFQTYLARAEELGFDSAWTHEQVLGSNPFLNPIEVLTFAAACTEQIRLGCAVFVSSLHSPIHLAKSVSTLDQLSRGRIEVGLGIGGRDRMLSAFGIDPDDLVDRFTEGLRLMKACWTEPQINFEGRFWQINAAAMEPKPFQRPHPPIWFGASKRAALRRAVRHADGFFGAGSSTTLQFAEQVQFLRTELTNAQRDDSSFPIAKRVYIAVNDDEAQARQDVAAGLDRIYGEGGAGKFESVAVAGSPDACVDGLAAVAAAGAEMILVNPLSNDLDQMERLAAEVLPSLRTQGS